MGRLIERHPGVLAYSISDRLDVVLKWLKKRKIGNIGSVIEANPSLLGSDVDLKLEPIYAWLRDQGVKNPGAVIEKNPNILSYDIDRTLEPLVEWLIEQGVTRLHIVLERAPQIFDLHIQDNLNPTIAWLKKQGVKKIGSVLTNYPAILGLGIEGNLRSNSTWLLRQGVPQSKLGSVLEKKPQILGLDIETNLNPKVKWLREQGIREMGDLIMHFPSLFGYSLMENIQPTWHELTTVWGLSAEEIEARPMILGASLERLQLLTTWAKAARVDLAQIPLTKKYRIIQSTSFEDVAHNLRSFRNEVAAQIHDRNLRLKALALVVDEFERTKTTHRYLMPPGRFLDSRQAKEECSAILAKTIERARSQKSP